MKAKFIFIVLSKVLIDVSFAANAQQANNPLSAMKDSFPVFTANTEDDVLLDTAPGCPVFN